MGATDIKFPVRQKAGISMPNFVPRDGFIIGKPKSKI